MAIGSAKSVDSTITVKEVTMSGRAPVKGMPASLVFCRSHLVPVKNSTGLTPSFKNAEMPLPATMNISASTTRVTSATHAPVTESPTFSRRRLGIVLTMFYFFSVTLPLASFATFISDTGMKPCFSTSLPWTSLESM